MPRSLTLAPMRIVHARHIVSTLVIARTSKLWKQASTAPSRAGRVHHQPQLHLQRNIVSILAIARSSKLWNQRSIAPPTTTRSHIRHNHQHQRRSFSLATTNDNNTPRTATDLAENTTTSESTMTSDVGADALITTVVTTSRGMAPPKVEQKTSFYRRPLSAPCVAFRYATNNVKIEMLCCNMHCTLFCEQEASTRSKTVFSLREDLGITKEFLRRGRQIFSSGTFEKGY